VKQSLRLPWFQGGHLHKLPCDENIVGLSTPLSYIIFALMVVLILLAEGVWPHEKTTFNHTTRKTASATDIQHFLNNFSGPTSNKSPKRARTDEERMWLYAGDMRMESSGSCSSWRELSWWCEWGWTKILAGITNTRLTRVLSYVPKCPEMTFFTH